MTTIWDLKANPWSDEPRYYPPGQHPATAHMRAELDAAEMLLAETRLREIMTGAEFDTTGVEGMIGYLKEELDKFEAGEYAAKAQSAAALKERS